MWLWSAVPLYVIGIVLTWTRSPYSKITGPLGMAFWLTMNFWAGKRRRFIRILLLVSTALMLPLLAADTFLTYVGRPVDHAPYYLARMTAIGVCRGVAAYLLFTREASVWYEKRPR